MHQSDQRRHGISNLLGASLEDDPAAHGLMRHLTRKWRKSRKVLAGTTPRFGVQGALQIRGCVKRHLCEEGGAVRAHRERIVARRIILDKRRWIGGRTAIPYKIRNHRLNTP